MAERRTERHHGIFRVAEAFPQNVESFWRMGGGDSQGRLARRVIGGDEKSGDPGNGPDSFETQNPAVASAEHLGLV